MDTVAQSIRLVLDTTSVSFNIHIPILFENHFLAIPVYVCVVSSHYFKTWKRLVYFTFLVKPVYLYYCIFKFDMYTWYFSSLIVKRNTLHVCACVHILPYRTMNFLERCVTVSESESMLHNYAYVCVPREFFPNVKCMIDVNG